MFIRRRRCGLSLRSFVPGSSPAGARGNKPCRACLRASVRFLRDQFGFAVKAKAGQRPNNSFKPSPLRGLGAGSYDSAIAVAATLPGLTQALGWARKDLRQSAIRIGNEPGFFFAFSAFCPARLVPTFGAGHVCSPQNAHRMSGRRDLKFALAWSQMVASESSWPQPNNSFKPRPLRGSATW